MMYYVFSVFDDKAEAFLPPFVLPKEAQALRLFSDCVNSESHQFGQNPADYSLFRLGTWDDSNGQYLLERTTHNLGNGLIFVKSTEIRGSGDGKANSQDQSTQGLERESFIQSSPSGEDSEV